LTGLPFTEDAEKLAKRVSLQFLQARPKVGATVADDIKLPLAAAMLAALGCDLPLHLIEIP